MEDTLESGFGPREGSVRLAPEVLWRPAEEGPRRRGLVRIAELCGNPACRCDDLRILAYEIDERFESVESGPEGCTFEHKVVTGLAGVPFADNIVEALGNLHGGATFVQDLETLSEDERRLLGWLQDSIDRTTLESWQRSWRALKDDPPDEGEEADADDWHARDWRDWDEREPILWSDIDPAEYCVCMHVDGRPFVVDEVHWLKEGENGQEVTLTFDELLPMEDLGDVGQVTVDVGSLSLLGTRCGPDQHDLLLRLWAAYQKRHRSELLAAHAHQFREEIRPEIRRLARTPLRRTAKVGRNEPCPCGSGKKHKRCCGR
jgi:hypothetical protein